jgi:hypothetical protein
MHKDDWIFVQDCSTDRQELFRYFVNRYGLSSGSPFRLWTKKRIYFSVTYDGLNSVDSVPIHPINDEFSEENYMIGNE